MKLRKEMGRVTILVVLSALLYFVIAGLISKAASAETSNSTALTHAVLAENATATW